MHYPRIKQLFTEHLSQSSPQIVEKKVIYERHSASFAVSSVHTHKTIEFGIKPES